MIVQFYITSIGTRVVYPCGFSGRYKARLVGGDILDTKGYKSGDHHMLQVKSDCFEHLFNSGPTGAFTRTILIDNCQGVKNQWSFILDNQRGGQGVDFELSATPAYGANEFTGVILTFELERLDETKEQRMAV